ncbi:MAG: hypothetical protein IJF67_00435 [Clostridia bacterium]|nr:hypothetical protein [Clostridia bacterium]
MLEEIALSISTLVFLLCNLVVNSIAPAAPALPMEPIPAETAADISVEAVVTSEVFELTGVWNSGGRVFEFTRSGKLLYNGQVMPFELDGSTMLVTAMIDGAERRYRLSFEPVSARVLKLNGVAMYKVDE